MDYLFNFNKLGYLREHRRPEGCILCLVASDSPSVERLIVHETPLVIVSLNLYPYNPGHLIIFPRRHVVDIRALDIDERTELDRLTRASLDALDKFMKPSGYNIGYNMGLAAGASIEHLHLHIIPRYEHEIGIVELIGGARGLVQDPRETQEKLSKLMSEFV
jgi:ATP adenylyltransferase